MTHMYAALGDSLTHGTDPEGEGRWPDAVAAALGCGYANLAKIGATTYFASVHGWDHDDADAAMLIAILLTAGSPS